MDAQEATFDLFDPAHVRRMVHFAAHRTEVDAAVKIARKVNALHELVMAAFREHGTLTDRELERLPAFAHLGPSTARKRRSELFQLGQLISTTERRDGLTVWRLP